MEVRWRRSACAGTVFQGLSAATNIRRGIARRFGAVTQPTSYLEARSFFFPQGTGFSLSFSVRDRLHPSGLVCSWQLGGPFESPWTPFGGKATPSAPWRAPTEEGCLVSRLQ
jgi:hypothetical protein